MNANHAVVDLPPIAVPLARDPRGLFATLGRARLVHTTDRFGVSVLLGHDLLASVSQSFFIPLDRFEKALQRPRRFTQLQGNGLSRLAVQIGKLTFDINSQ